jgi:hypothetical protein
MKQVRRIQIQMKNIVNQMNDQKTDPVPNSASVFT